MSVLDSSDRFPKEPDRLWYADPTGDAAVRNMMKSSRRSRPAVIPTEDVDLEPLMRRLQRSLDRF